MMIMMIIVKLNKSETKKKKNKFSRNIKNNYPLFCYVLSLYGGNAVKKMRAGLLCDNPFFTLGNWKRERRGERDAHK